ncbi:hypothetical protein AF332_15370 [Sporosarcina globispora]|uniref:t-SNARE coiled-coil homology domain-containing protein n=1 Tax=Sporosarcina globispora TaxID=1459 RepID=A0A0M0GF49_SPOGL|nr:hypothetical protein [Sporosarcina globispora]KON88056.1 hypothetical protein AF332_15370 [Sporosarcina globispora]
MEKTLNLILNKLESLDQKVDSMEKRMGTMDQKISSMDKRHTADLKRHEDLIQQLIHSVAATNVKMNETNEKLSVIDTKVEQAIEHITDINKTVATKHDLAYYDQKISEHSRQIYKMNNQ